MMELKRISAAAIPSALAKAERYRLLNEPSEAESICLDVLATEPDNQQALVTLLLALTDGFGASPAVDVKQPTDLVARLKDPYARHYYAGIIHERWARALLARGAPPHISLGWIREAMRQYEKAAALNPPGNEDAILRWNACLRTFQRAEPLQPGPAEFDLTSESAFDDEMPTRPR
jgi:hypothetical protein